MANAVKIRKGNKVRYIEAGRLEAFLRQGFEQIDEETGEVIRRATGGSVVPIAQYNQLLDVVEELKEENKALKEELAKSGKKVDKQKVKEENAKKDDGK